MTQEIKLPAALLKIVAKHPELAVTFLRDVAREEGPMALEAAGVEPADLKRVLSNALAADLKRVLSNALAAGHKEVAGQLAGQLTDGSLAQARAATEAYAELVSREPWSGWEPDFGYYDAWFHLARSKPGRAALWIDSGALKIPPDDFWKFIAREAHLFESTGSVEGLSAYCARSEARGHCPRPGEVAALGPIALGACADGFASAGEWMSLRDVADCLREAFEDLDLKDSSLDAERARLEAQALVVAQAAAPWALSHPRGAKPLGLSISLAEISAAAGVAFALGAAEVPIDVRDLDGHLSQPSPNRMSDHAATWTLNGDSRQIQNALEDIPSIVFPFSEIAAHWTSKRGRQVAKGAGFKATPRSEATFETLKALAGLARRSPARSALIERLALTAITPEAAPSRAPRL